MRASLFLLVCAAFAQVSAAALVSEKELNCSQGTAHSVGYEQISIRSERAIAESSTVGTNLTVDVVRVVALGKKKRATVITNRLAGRVIPDIRPLPRPDPATVIDLYGEDEVGNPRKFGLLIVRPRLDQAGSIELRAADGDDTTVPCND